MKQFFFDKQFRLLCLGVGSQVALMITVEIMTNMLFLSQYPATWIPAYFASHGALLFSFGLIGPTIIAKLQYGTSRSLLLFYTGVLLFAALLINSHFYYATFFLCLGLKILIPILSAVVWNIVSNVLDHRAFKANNLWLNWSCAFCAISTGLIVPAILALTKASSQILILILGCYLFALYLTHRSLVQCQGERGEGKTQQRLGEMLSHCQRPLMVSISVMSFLVIISVVLFDAQFKKTLALNYSEARIGEITGLVTAGVNFFVLCLQPLVIPFLLRRFHTAVCAGLSFLIYLLSVVAYFLYPTVQMVIATYCLVLFNQFVFYGIGERLVINALPELVRSYARLCNRTYIQPLGFIAASGLLYVLNQFALISAPYIAILILSLLGVAVIVKLRKDYFNELHHAIATRRYAPEYQCAYAEESLLQMSGTALAIGSPAAQEFTLELLERVAPGKINIALDALIDSPDAGLREKALRLLARVPHTKYVASIQSLLQREQNPKVIWYAYCYLANVGVATNTAASPGDEEFNLALQALMALSTADQDIVAEALAKLLSSGTDSAKHWLVLLLERGIRVGDDALDALLTDRDPEFVAAAAKLIPNYQSERILRRGLELLSAHIDALLIIESFSQLAELPVEMLRSYFHSSSPAPYRQRAVIIILARHESIAATTLLFELIETVNIAMRAEFAKHCALRLLKQPFHEQMQHHLFTALSVEVQYYNQLLALSIRGKWPAPVAEVIQLRIDSCVKNALYWVIALTGAVSLFEVLPSLCHRRDSFQLAKAIEVLEMVLADNVVLQRVIVEMMEQKRVRQKPRSYVGGDLFVHDTILAGMCNPQCEEEKMINEELTLFRRFEFCKNLPLEVVLALAADFSRQSIVAGEVVFEQGARGDNFYLLMDGEVELSREGLPTKLLGKGSYFGELALLDNSVRTMRAVAKCDGLLYTLKASDFERLCDEMPEILRAFLRHTIHYYRESLG